MLAGRADRVGLIGLDRWIGGTHLTPFADWRFDAETATLSLPTEPIGNDLMTDAPGRLAAASRLG